MIATNRYRRWRIIEQMHDSYKTVPPMAIIEQMHDSYKTVPPMAIIEQMHEAMKRLRRWQIIEHKTGLTKKVNEGFENRINDYQSPSPNRIID